jgi:hypothetical protein
MFRLLIERVPLLARPAVGAGYTIRTAGKPAVAPKFSSNSEHQIARRLAEANGLRADPGHFAVGPTAKKPRENT